MGVTDNNSNSSNGNVFNRISNALENKLVMLFIASILGTSSGLALIKTKPTSFCTNLTCKALDDKIRQLEQKQSLDNAHRVASIEWLARVRKLEVGMAECKTRISNFEHIRGSK